MSEESCPIGCAGNHRGMTRVAIAVEWNSECFDDAFTLIVLQQFWHCASPPVGLRLDIIVLREGACWHGTPCEHQRMAMRCITPVGDYQAILAITPQLAHHLRGGMHHAVADGPAPKGEAAIDARWPVERPFKHPPGHFRDAGKAGI